MIVHRSMGFGPGGITLATFDAPPPPRQPAIMALAKPEYQATAAAVAPPVDNTKHWIGIALGAAAAIGLVVVVRRSS
jgi:hypothetical protein